MTVFMKVAATAAVAALTAAFAVPANAVVVRTDANVSFAGGSTTFGYGGETFTLGAQADFFNPVTVRTSANAAVDSLSLFGPASPTSYFDPIRGSGTVLFGSGMQYTSFASATTISGSVTPTYVGLAVTLADGLHYGYTQFESTFLKSYAFESVAGQSIAAGALAPIPEPETYALMAGGLGLVGWMARRKAKRASRLA